jgi:3',5'-cyclic AMP phosphodiesterase CpdA
MRAKYILIFLLIVCTVALNAVVAVFGDTRDGYEINGKIAAYIAAYQPTAVFHTGDLNTYGTSQKEYDRFHAINDPITKVAPLYIAKGNHERNTQLFLLNFPILDGRTYYTVEHDSIVWIALDTTLKIGPGSEQYKWLQTQLESFQGKPIFIFMHHPIFSSGKHGDELGLNLYMPKLLQQYTVKAVFAGHDHGYERSELGGIYYITTAGGGAPLYDNSSLNKQTVKFRKVNNYCIVERTTTSIKVTAYDLNQQIIDSFDVSLK